MPVTGSVRRVAARLLAGVPVFAVLVLAARIAAGQVSAPASAPSPGPSGSASSAPVSLPPAPHLRATRVAVPPVLDGKLDDPAWTRAPPAASFRQKMPNDGAAPSEPTTVRILYDDDAVYVGVDCPQRTPVTQRMTRRDRWTEADAFSVDLGTRGDHKSAFEFAINASGTLYDSIRFNDTDYSQDWDENWDARTSATDHGWTAEFRIPLRILRFPTMAVQSWDLQFTRYISSKQEYDTWAYFPRSVGGEVSHYGRLDDLDGLRERTPIEFRPFLVGRMRRRDPTVGQLASGTDFTGSAVVDLKWHPTGDLTLDATINPDFAQVEADQVVLNLSTVPYYYPEKRPFFLEGIDAFSTPFQLLYTRRIGRVPPLPSLRTDPVNSEQLVDVPEATTIYGASKLTGRLSEHWSIGTVQAVTGTNDVQVQLGSGQRVSRRLDPLSSFNVVRLKRDIGDNAHVAFTATAVTHAESTDAYPLMPPSAWSPSPAVLCPAPVTLNPFQSTSQTVAPGSRCFNDAYVGAVDWKWRSSDGMWSVGGQVVGTVLENGPPRPVADGTVIHPGDIGGGLLANLNKDGGTHWVGGIGADIETRAEDITDLGFNPRANLMQGSGWIEYRELEPSGVFLENHVNLNVNRTDNIDGLLLNEPVYLNDWGHLTNFWWYYGNVHVTPARFDDREVGDGTALERATRLGGEFAVSTDPTQPILAGIDQTTEAITDGFNSNGNATLSMKLMPQLDLDVLPTWQQTYGEPRFVANAFVPGRYVFGKLDARSVGVTLRTTYTFMPRLTLQGYAQLFLASGHYSNFTQFQSDPGGPRPHVRVQDLSPYVGQSVGNYDFEQGVLNVNVVLRWEYLLGSTLYLVYTRAQVPTTTLGPTDIGTLNLGAVGRAPTSDVILAKVSFWWGP